MTNDGIIFSINNVARLFIHPDNVAAQLYVKLRRSDHVCCRIHKHIYTHREVTSELCFLPAERCGTIEYQILCCLLPNDGHGNSEAACAGAHLYPFSANPTAQKPMCTHNVYK